MYLRAAKYVDDPNNATPSMRTFIDDVLMPKSCKLKPESKRVLRKFLYNVENALSHAWTRATVIFVVEMGRVMASFVRAAALTVSGMERHAC